MVDASGAGVETICPGCERRVIVPQLGSLMDRAYAAPQGEQRIAGKSGVTALAGLPESSRRTPLAEASLSKSDLDRDLTAGRTEAARAQPQLAALTAERDKLQADAAQAAAKQRQAEDDLELAGERARALQAELTARDGELGTARDRIAALQREHTDAKDEISRLHDESDLHRHNYDDARAKLTTAEKLVARAEATGTELLATKEKLTAAEEHGRTLERNCAGLHTEMETLRREFARTESGRELLDLRGRLASAENDRARMEAELAKAQSEILRHAESEKETQAQLLALRTARDEALRLAETGSESGLKQVNEILRGVLDRQQAELDERYAELRRLKRAQLGTRILYAVFAILLLALIAYAIHIVPRTFFK